MYRRWHDYKVNNDTTLSKVYTKRNFGITVRLVNAKKMQRHNYVLEGCRLLRTTINSLINNNNQKTSKLVAKISISITLISWDTKLTNTLITLVSKQSISYKEVSHPHPHPWRKKNEHTNTTKAVAKITYRSIKMNECKAHLSIYNLNSGIVGCFKSHLNANYVGNRVSYCLSIYYSRWLGCPCNNNKQTKTYPQKRDLC